MGFKEISPKLQLSFDEYVETWNSVITEYYFRGLDPEITEKELGLADEDIIGYSMNLEAIVLIIAVKILEARVKTTENISKKTTEEIISKFYTNLYNNETAQLKEKAIEFFRFRYNIFNKICLNLANRDIRKRQPELIGLARYLLSQVSNKPESENAKAIEKLSLIFIDVTETCIKLADNSGVENIMLGKIKFIVQK